MNKDNPERLAASPSSGAVRVKPLEWHKSSLTPWNDDWHTISPFMYSVRCADENGWKWGFSGGFGYASSADEAKAAAQSDYEQRIRSAIDALVPADGVREALAAVTVDLISTAAKDEDPLEWESVKQAYAALSIPITAGSAALAQTDGVSERETTKSEDVPPDERGQMVECPSCRNSMSRPSVCKLCGDAGEVTERQSLDFGSEP